MKRDIAAEERYNMLLAERNKWNYYESVETEHKISDMLLENRAEKFIQDVFLQGGKSQAINIEHSDMFLIARERANHTLSAFLLGIILQEELHISMRELPKLHDSIHLNFLYFWSLTCLYHDYATRIEDESSIYFEQLDTIEKFEDFFKVEYSLVKDSSEGELYKNYYLYRASEKIVDHGIAGATLIYDALMQEYNNALLCNGEKKKARVEHNSLTFSKDFPKHVMFIANTIAKHNLWRASPDREEVYRNFNLEQLIPNENGDHIISLDEKKKNIKNKFLFILGLVDTLEPIKCMGRDKNICIENDPIKVLQEIKLRFDYKERALYVICPERWYADYSKNAIGLKDWLDVRVECIDQTNEVKIVLNRMGMYSKI